MPIGCKQDPPVKILRLIARLNIGGPAIQAVKLTQALRSRGYETLLVCGRTGPAEGDMRYLAEREGVKPVVVPQLGREISLAEDAAAMYRIAALIRRFQPDILHTHTAKAGTLGRLAAVGRRAGPLRVHTFHGHIFDGYFSRRKTAVFLGIERLLAQTTDAVVVLSPQQKKDICGNYRIAPPHKVHTIPLGFELDRFAACRLQRKAMRGRFLGDSDNGVFLVGIIGRLTPVKNHAMLLRAMSLLQKRRKLERFKCLIVGDGELRRDLENQAETLGVRQHLLFVGWRRDMPGVYAALDAVVLTSLNEGTPVALIEAMASGVPAAAARVGGVGDLLGVGSAKGSRGVHAAARGLLVPPGDAHALADALLFLRRNSEKVNAMVHAARVHALKHYSFERLVNDIDRLYTKLRQKNVSRRAAKAQRNEGAKKEPMQTT